MIRTQIVALNSNQICIYNSGSVAVCECSLPYKRDEKGSNSDADVIM